MKKPNPNESGDYSMNGIRFCSNCMTTKNTIGGSYKIINGGKGRRWRCVDCTKIVKERDERRI
jgi:hypothetical protein